ncbi:MAG: DegV family protein [Oscillospiraceae bacterium]|nr:DegV family protein [Oscillospiraceae bacterium]
MSDYVLVTDSTADLSLKQIRDSDLIVIPMMYTIDSKNYLNDLSSKDLSMKDYFDLIRQGRLATTSQINSACYMEHFEKILQDKKDILYIGFSSALSGSYSSSLIAIKELSKRYPDRKMLAVDSLAACGGEGLLVYLTSLQKKMGATLQEAYDFAQSTKLKIAHWFVVDDLMHLKRGGRLSSTSAFFGTLFGIRPVLHVDNEGRLIPVTKARGKKAAFNIVLKKMKETIDTKSEQLIIINHADVLDQTKEIAKSIKQNLNVKIVINNMGTVIGAHAGPGTIAVFFKASKR